jgi:predicted enzyme related to lactoylglutathione lyase
MEMRLEVVPLPVVDVDASIAFYLNKVGFVLDHDVSPGNGMRVVQLTPPGSACSIVFGTGMSDPNRSARVENLHLVVSDIAAARDELTGRGVDVSEINDLGGVQYAHFGDPDGNSWALQEIPKR